MLENKKGKNEKGKNEITEIKIAAFGCWNTGCEKSSGQHQVTQLLKSKEKGYNFMIILGDNYYAPKTLFQEEVVKEEVVIKGIKTVNIDSRIMKAGFDCLDTIDIQKKNNYG